MARPLHINGKPVQPASVNSKPSPPTLSEERRDDLRRLRDALWARMNAEPGPSDRDLTGLALQLRQIASELSSYEVPAGELEPDELDILRARHAARIVADREAKGLPPLTREERRARHLPDLGPDPL